MLCRAPTRIELKPEDRHELDEMQKLNRKQNKWPPPPPPQPEHKSAAQRIGVQPPQQGGSPARFR
jgi:hypothetical protein